MFKKGDRVEIVDAEHFRCGQKGTIAGPPERGEWPVDDLPGTNWTTLYRTDQLRKA
ncbi:hypothetical protein [Streptomyces sp. NPDC050704]|uniref:hypothetical protein n=1 Tax=Streptomyces sp. NPDC050704 TaxID=3157219 RepID=UPI003428D7F9